MFERVLDQRLQEQHGNERVTGVGVDVDDDAEPVTEPDARQVQVRLGHAEFVVQRDQARS